MSDEKDAGVNELRRTTLAVFRAKEAPVVEETDATSYAPMSSGILDAVGRVKAAGGTVRFQKVYILRRYKSLPVLG